MSIWNSIILSIISGAVASLITVVGTRKNQRVKILFSEKIQAIRSAERFIDDYIAMTDSDYMDVQKKINSQEEYDDLTFQARECLNGLSNFVNNGEIIKKFQYILTEMNRCPMEEIVDEGFAFKNLCRKELCHKRKIRMDHYGIKVIAFEKLENKFYPNGRNSVEHYK